MKTLTRYEEKITKGAFGRTVREIYEAGARAPAATIKKLPRTGAAKQWYYIQSPAFAATIAPERSGEATAYASTLPQARRQAYTMIIYAEAMTSGDYYLGIPS
ncbi:MAG: hypothetical protein NVS3B1_28060 [Marmoricola sp.]